MLPTLVIYVGKPEKNTIMIVIFGGSGCICNNTVPLRFTLVLHNFCIFCNNHQLPSLIAVTVSISAFTHHVREKFGETQERTLGHWT